jgi:two-component system, response regulator PdtaR
MKQLRVFVAVTEQAQRNAVKEILTRNSYIIVGESNDGMTALKMIRSLQPDLVIIDANLPIMDGFAIADILEEDKIAPFVMLVDYKSWQGLSKVKEGRAITYIIMPVNEMNLIPAVDVAVDHFTRVVGLQKEIADLKNTLETRKLVEKAKGILMKSLGITEQEAFKRIQKQSMNKRVSIKSIAEAVILADEFN